MCITYALRCLYKVTNAACSILLNCINYPRRLASLQYFHPGTASALSDRLYIHSYFTIYEDKLHGMKRETFNSPMMQLRMNYWSQKLYGRQFFHRMPDVTWYRAAIFKYKPHAAVGALNCYTVSIDDCMSDL